MAAMAYSDMDREQDKQGTGGPVSDQWMCGGCNKLTNRTHYHEDDEGIMHHISPETIDSIKRGIADAHAGRAKPMTFAKHLDEPDDDDV